LRTIGEALLLDDDSNSLESIGKAIPAAPSNITGWRDGSTEINYDWLFLFFAACDFPISAIQFPDAGRVIRQAIACALTYVRVYPPAPEFVEAGEGFTERESRCWTFIRKHRLFKDKRPLDRRIWDEVEGRFPDLLLKSENIPKLKDIMDHPIREHEMMNWLDYWTVFIYATRYRDRIYWLWDDNHPQYVKIWSQDGQ
jgi:hypothetical protein